MACVIRLMCIIVLLCAPLSVWAQPAPTVLFDNSHGEKFVIDGDGTLHLSGLAEAVRGAGARVVAGDQPISDATLQGVDALVISGAFQPLTPAELEAVTRFMTRGGRVAVMLHVAPPMAGLLGRLGITYTNGVVQEHGDLVEAEPINFKVKDLSSHPVFRGVDSFTVYGAWGLLARGGHGRTVAATSPQAWVDLAGDKVQRPETTAAFGIAVAGEIGKGGFVVFGDDAIFQNKFLVGNNKTVAANLAAWLQGGTTQPATAPVQL